MSDRFEEPCGWLQGAGAPESHVAQQSRRDKLRFHHLLQLPPQQMDIPASSTVAANAEHAGYQLSSHFPAGFGTYPFVPPTPLYGVSSQEQQLASTAFRAVQGAQLPGSHSRQTDAVYAAITSSPAAGCGWANHVGLAAANPIGSLPFANLSGAPAPMLGFPHQAASGAWMDATAAAGSEMSLLPGYVCPADASSGGGWPPLGHADDLPAPNCRLGPNTSSLPTGVAPPHHMLALSLSSSAPPLDLLTSVQETTSIGTTVGGSLPPRQLASQEVDLCRNPAIISGFPKFSGSGSNHAQSTDPVPPPVQQQPLRSPVAVADSALRLPGPLGPFTGYAAILRNSKFLRPAQQLLDESCTLAEAASSSYRRPLGFTVDATHGSSQHLSAGCSHVLSFKGTASPWASSLAPAMPNASPPCARGDGRSGDCDLGPQQPEFHDKKAKLLFLQAEVCKKYKQYNQQIQMAVSSFESVAGLSSAIPFLSVAIKSVCKHFRFLKHVIAGQLTHISRVLGEELVSSSSRNSLLDPSTTPRLKFLEQTLRKQKAEQTGIAFSDNRQPVWRPQRGLPERAVAVLRAWLFDHFLHPYPTDADKIMLASQTGLSRNQVSNWFINARVRVWKPMVEEIHKLETKGLSDVNLNSSVSSSTQVDLAEFRTMQPVQEQQQQQQDALIPSNCSSTIGLLPEIHTDLWHQDKRSRMEDVYATGGFGAYGREMVAGFSAYTGGLDMGTFGAVSLTLGLKQDERSWHPQQYQQLRPYLDSQMVRD